MTDPSAREVLRGTWDGGCNCGAVRFRARNLNAEVLACHCRQCRRVSGHYYAATAAVWADVELSETRGLAWHDLSASSRRGFCRDCGCSLFFDRGPDQALGIAAGAFDEEPPFTLAAHIWTDEAGRYYDSEDGRPHYTAERWRRESGWERYRG